MQVLIWVVGVSQVMAGLDRSPMLAVAYAGGFAAGNDVGIAIEKRPISFRFSETTPTMRPNRSQSGPPPSPGFIAVVMMERSIADLDRIYINGGRRGFLVSMSPSDLIRVLSPTAVDAAA